MLSRNRISASLLSAAFGALLFLQGCASKEEKIARALNEADILISNEKNDEAIAVLQENAKRFPDEASLFEALGDALADRSKGTEAINALRTSVSLDTSRARLWVRIADLERSLNRNREAIDAYRNYLKAYPSDFLAWKSLTAVLQDTGDRPATIKSAMEWNRVRPSSEPTRLLGELFLEGGNLPQARSWYSQSAAYEAGEASRDSLAALIELEIGLQQFLPAETWIKRYEERYPNDGNDVRVLEATDVLARWRQAQREIAEASSQIEAQEKELEAKRAAAAEAERLAREEREQRLKEQLDQTNTNPDDSTDAVLPEEELVKAPTPLPDSNPIASTPQSSTPVDPEPSVPSKSSIETYWDALGENPDDPENWRALAALYFDQGNFAEAESYILEARRRAPRSPEINAFYLNIIAQSGNTKQILEEAAQIRSQFPQSPLILLNFARTIQKAGANRNQVTDAYQSFLDMAEPSIPGYQEAQRFLNEEK